MRPVQLLVSLDEAGPQLYGGGIVQIANADQLTKNLVIRVTDSRLLQATGGVIAGRAAAPSCRMGSWLGRLPMCSQRTHHRLRHFCPGDVGRVSKLPGNGLNRKGAPPDMGGAPFSPPHLYSRVSAAIMITVDYKEGWEWTQQFAGRRPHGSQPYRSQLLRRFQRPPCGIPPHKLGLFYRPCTEQTAFVVDLLGNSPHWVEVAPGFASTAFTRIKGQ